MSFGNQGWRWFERFQPFRCLKGKIRPIPQQNQTHGIKNQDPNLCQLGLIFNSKPISSFEPNALLEGQREYALSVLTNYYLRPLFFATLAHQLCELFESNVAKIRALREYTNLTYSGSKCLRCVVEGVFQLQKHLLVV